MENLDDAMLPDHTNGITARNKVDRVALLLVFMLFIIKISRLIFRWIMIVSIESYALRSQVSKLLCVQEAYSDPFYKVTNNIKWVTTSWTYSIVYEL